MRLLECSDGKVELTKDLVVGIPKYAILSHTWGPDTEEVTYRDLVDGTGEDKPGYEKIRFCAAQAKRDGLRYFWVDTCCIDKSNNTELSEAINSMFRWYQTAARCYVYLSDISASGHEEDSRSSEFAWESAFRKSKWFTRGWTLQELLAPPSVEFFTTAGWRLGDKRSLERQIHEITGIAVSALRGKALVQFDIEERFKWAEKRQTTREEDQAYCLLGIFDISMPLIYGEGRAHAVRRLKKEIDEARNRNDTPNSHGDHAALPRHSIPLRENQRFAGRNRTLDTLKAILFKRKKSRKAAIVGHRAVLPCHYIPLRENRRFVGRDSILDTLQAILFKRKESQKAAIVGLGGIGKTQVALQFAYWAKTQRPKYSVFWVPALSKETFEQAYTEIALQLAIEKSDDEEDLKESVRRFLDSGTAGPWLLVVDNADDKDILLGSAEMPGGINKYLPENGLTLFTTRSQEVAVSVAGNDVIELHEMDPPDAADLLKKSLIQKDMLCDKETTAELLKGLTYLPLAITQAAAYINITKLPLRRYLELLHSTEQNIIDLMSREIRDNTRYRGSQNAIATTWLVSFDQICKSDSAAADLLEFISCIESKAIPQSMLPRFQSKEQMVHALGTLCGYAFLTRRRDSQIFDMHSLVHLATRIWVQRMGRTTQANEKAIQCLETIFPRGDYVDRDVWREYLPHAFRVLQSGEELDIEEKAALCHWIGWCLRVDGRYKEALRYFTEACQWRNFHLPENHPDRLASQHGLAIAYEPNGQVQEAIALLEQVVAIQKRVLTEDHPNQLASQHELAMSYRSNGQVQEAIALLEQIVAIQKKVLTEDHPNQLASQHVLAMSYRDNGQVQESIALLEQVVAIRKRVLTEDHPNQLASQHELAMSYRSNGQVQEAIALLEQIVAIQKKVLTEDHPNQLTSQHVLAISYQANGQVQEAVMLLEEVVAIRKRVLAEDHHDLLLSQEWLAYCLEQI